MQIINTQVLDFDPSPNSTVKCCFERMRCYKARSNTCKQTREETSCSNTPNAMTGSDVKNTLKSEVYQSL